jgi:hypothetical protein
MKILFDEAALLHYIDFAMGDEATSNAEFEKLYRKRMAELGAKGGHSKSERKLAALKRTTALRVRKQLEKRKQKQQTN